MEKPNCKKCRYRIHLANLTGIHVFEEDCDKYGSDLCEKMNNPDFIKFMDERNGKDGTENHNNHYFHYLRSADV